MSKMEITNVDTRDESTMEYALVKKQMKQQIWNN